MKSELEKIHTDLKLRASIPTIPNSNSSHICKNDR